MDKKIIKLENHSKAIGKYSPAIMISIKKNDRMVFITGQVATDSLGNIIGIGDAELQTEEVFKRIDSLLIKSGGSIKDLVSITIFISNRKYFKAVSEVRNSWLNENPPASTMVVSELMEDGCIVEINGIAVFSGEKN